MSLVSLAFIINGSVTSFVRPIHFFHFFGGREKETRQKKERREKYVSLFSTRNYLSSLKNERSRNNRMVLERDTFPQLAQFRVAT